MKVTVKIIKEGKLKTITYKGIQTVLWEDSWVRLVWVNSRVQRVSYRKELVFAIIEEWEGKLIPIKITDLR